MHARNSAILELASIRATKAGVDASGNFWAWDAKRRFVTRITPNGDRYESDILPGAMAADADQQRGIALLSESGRVVSILDWNGAQKRSIHLLHMATDIAWLGGNHVAVTPRLIGPCVEIWDVSTGAYLSGFGTCPQIVVPRPGLVAARATLIRFDRAHNEIITFDAFSGEMLAFTDSGSITRRSHVLNPRAAAIAVGLKEADANARRRGVSSAPMLRFYATMTLTSDGTIWIGEDADAKGVVTAVKILPSGAVQRARMNVAQCPSIRFTEWNDSFVFFRDPSSPQPACVAVRRRER